MYRSNIRVSIIDNAFVKFIRSWLAVNVALRAGGRSSYLLVSLVCVFDVSCRNFVLEISSLFTIRAKSYQCAGCLQFQIGFRNDI